MLGAGCWEVGAEVLSALLAPSGLASEGEMRQERSGSCRISVMRPCGVEVSLTLASRGDPLQLSSVDEDVVNEG